MRHSVGDEEVNFVFRLNLGAHFYDSEGSRVSLTVKKGEPRILNKVFYRGKVFVNVIGFWQEGFKEPIWIEQGLSFYRQRMKIDEAFKDLKNSPGMDKMMFQKRHWMEMGAYGTPAYLSLMYLMNRRTST